MIAKIRNGAVVIYPYTIGLLKRDNPNISFPSEIPEDILNSFGCFSVTERTKPVGDIVTERPPVLLDGKWTQVWYIRDFSYDELVAYKSRTKDKLAAVRYKYETNHPTIDTSRSSQAMINGAWTATQIDPNMIIDFKSADGTWLSIGKEEIQIISSRVATYVQKCFTYEKVLQSHIDAAETKSEVDAIDLEYGWDDCVISPQSTSINTRNTIME